MTLKEYLLNCEDDELIKKLIYLDASLKSLHEHGYYVTYSLSDIIVNDDIIDLSSFENKVDLLKDGLDPDGDKHDILELATIGLFAYNEFTQFYYSKDIVVSITENIEQFLVKVPEELKDYYRNIFNGEIEYLNDYLIKINKDKKENLSMTSKSTDVGKAFSHQESQGYANVLTLPVIFILLYFVCFIIYSLIKM